MKKIFILIVTLLTFSHVKAQTCESLFAAESGFSFVDEPGLSRLVVKNSVSEWAVLAAAKNDILGSPNLNEKIKKQIYAFFVAFHQNAAFHEKLIIEAQRRRYHQVLHDMGIRVYQDPITLLTRAKPYLSLLFSIAANSGTNLLSYHYLNHYGYVIHIPETRLFNPRSIPDDVLIELISSQDETPKTNQYVKTRVKYGADVVLRSIKNVFNIGIISVLMVSNYLAVMNPQAYLENHTTNIANSVAKMAYQQNLDLIHQLKGQKAETLIDRIEKQNKNLQDDEKNESK